MLLTPHVFIGLVIAKFVPIPFLAVFLAFLSHFLGDLTPHWDFFSGTKKEERLKGWRPLAVMADFGIGIGIGTLFTAKYLWVDHNVVLALTSFLCGIFAVLPDVLEAPYIYLNSAPSFIEGLTNIQRKLQTQAPILIGITIQVMVILGSLIYLI
ncbi:MAG: hypothetical protein ABIB98_00405 [bacterium]